MRKEYRIFAIRLALITTLSSAVVMPGASLVPSCYATTSEAQQEADLKVSLSADKIIEILRQEPGLLLQVKRMLIQKAYEQGRILESSDLTDDALFHLLRENSPLEFHPHLRNVYDCTWRHPSVVIDRHGADINEPLDTAAASLLEQTPRT